MGERNIERETVWERDMGRRREKDRETRWERER